MKITNLKKLVLTLISIVLIIIIIKYLKIINGLCIILKILAPVFIGFIYAWLLNPLINKLSKKYKRNIVCIITFLLIISFILGLLIILIPTIYKEIQEVITLLPKMFDTIQAKISKLNIDINTNKIIDFLITNIPIYIINFIQKTIKYLGIIVIGLILGLYASIDYEKIVLSFYKIIPLKYKETFIKLSTQISSNVHKCVNGTLLIASIVFVGDTICFLFLGLDAPLLLGLLCGLTDLIPYIGPYIGGAIAVLVAFTESKTLCILTIISCVIVQIIENNILQPIIMSKTMKISPIFILIGLLIFGNLFGIIGMLLASPIIAIIKVILDYLYTKKQNLL